MLLSDDIPGSVNAHETPLPSTTKISHVLVLDSQPLYSSALRSVIDSSFHKHTYWRSPPQRLPRPRSAAGALRPRDC